MSTNDEEVEDYMSDTFVPKDDVRPSLLLSHSSKVKHESLKKRLASNKRKGYYTELENQMRESALDRPLDQTNRGFKMLGKMGFNFYQPIKKESDGQSSSETSTDRLFTTEPIRIRLKNDRMGFGSRFISVESDRKAFEEKLTEEQFLRNKRSKNQLTLIEKDLKTAQNVCRNLDIDSGFTDEDFLTQTVRPKWFWPPIEEQTSVDDTVDGVTEEQEEEEETVNEESDEFKLKSINYYLRDKYLYCIWCGNRYMDIQDLSDNCLGNTRDDHDQ